MSSRILIADDVAANRIVQKARLAAACYDPLLAADGAACLSLIQEGRPDLVLLDLDLPDMSGLEVLQRLRRDSLTRDIPVIALAARGATDDRRAALAAGADDVLEHPINERVMMARLRNLLRLKTTHDLSDNDSLAIPGLSEAPATFDPQGTIAVVASLPDPGQALCDALADRLRDRLVVQSGRDALAEIAAGSAATDLPEVYLILDQGQTPAETLRLLSELKSRQSTRHAAVCVVGPAGSGEAAAMAFDLGADDAVGPDITPEELALRIRGLLRRKRQGDCRRARMENGLRLAMVDPLTGLFNRRYVAPQLSAIAARARKDGGPFAVMVMDLDRFKQVNDSHGHAAGDQVLVEVARRLTANLRDNDILARVGGEEFLAILPASGIPVARLVAERLCRVVDDQPVVLSTGETLHVTLSIGVAVADAPSGTGPTAEALVHQADLALLDSKNSGRNQVTFRRSAA